MTSHSYDMPNVLEAVDECVLALKSVVAAVLDDDACIRFEICMAEVLTNIVRHARATGNVVPIRMHFNEDENVLAEVFDPEGAQTFDPRDHANAPDEAEAMSESGRGLWMINQCADSIEYGATNGHNRLALGFKNNRAA